MIAFNRDLSGVYLSVAPETARVAFLFEDALRVDPVFDLTAASWLALKDTGYFAFVTPSATRDWASFATQARTVFTASYQAQLGWFSDEIAVQPVLIALDWSEGTPVVAQTFSLAFRESVTLTVLTSFAASGPTMTFDDASGAFQLIDTAATGQVFQLTAAPPAGGSSSYYSSGTVAVLPVAGDLAATLGTSFGFTADDLTQFEAGMMYFNPPQSGGLIQALGYPLFRAAGAPDTPFGFAVTLDVLAPLDPLRSLFQFTDPVLGTNYVTANGKPVYFESSADDVASTSRFVFASRPVQATSDTSNYYLTPAGQFAVSLTDGSSATPPSGAVAPTATQVLCGITGTEFLDVALGSALGSGGGNTGDRLEFVPGQPAYRLPDSADTAAAPAYLSDAATTSYARVVATAGAYVSQPQSAPLFAQASSGTAVIADAAPASGLGVYVLDFLPIESWTAAQDAPATPFVPYGGLAFATDPDLQLSAYLDMESNALNPRRADAYLTAPPQAGKVVVRPGPAALAATGSTLAMTPQGMLAQIDGTPPAWTALQMATSSAGILAFDSLGPAMRKAVQQNQIFTVVSTDPGSLFGFAQSDLTIGDWTFDLSPGGLAAPDGTPPIFLMKFYPGQPIAALVDDLRLWSQPDVFNTAPFPASAAQAFLQATIAAAKAAVFAGGGPDPDTDSLYWPFYETVTDPAFSGILAVNCSMRLATLPGAIRAVLGGMVDPGIAGFRVHHVGVAINNTDPTNPQPTLARSAAFALVDYEKTKSLAPSQALALALDYSFDVEFLRALFVNAELRSFACQLNLTINSLFETGVNQVPSAATRGTDDGNTITIVGAYQANATSGDDSSAGEGLYSFVAQGLFVYDFTDPAGQPNSSYLKSITLTKLQFSFDAETPVSCVGGVTTTRIASHFGIWGSIAFNELQVLDIFAFEKLEFSNLGIDVGFNLVLDETAQPSTDKLTLAFAPGDLRLDLGATAPRSGDTSLLALIPFKLKSFLYATGDGQSIDSIDYYSLSSIPGLKENGIALQDSFNYALIFDLDLGSLGGLVGSLSAFKFNMIIGWQTPAQGGGIAFGVQLPQVDGKLEIKIQGVLTIAIEQFTLLYATDSDPKMLVLGLQDCFIELLGTRIPPAGTVSIGLFAPTEGADQIGWIGAYNKGEDGGGGDSAAPPLLPVRDARDAVLTPMGQGEDDGGVFELIYVGLGQRVGPDPASPPTSYADFLAYMQKDFWEKLKDKEFAEIYHPDGRWIFVADFKLLKLIEIGVVFYDVTPFYALQISLIGGPGSGFSFEITYTKVTDTIGLYAIKIALPDSLRTFQVGVASLTLPTLSVSIYTNGNWKVDLGFPDGDDWSGSFRIQAQAGPVPVTGAGGFYIAMLSSATDPDVFKGDYATIAAFGFALRLGVGKDFVAGPLKAGVSVTFFGIIQGAAGYLSDGGDIFRTPDALSLQGQVGIIGELYGALDFIIIKASVNVRLQASIGIILTYEPKAPGGGDGSILLYIEASVSVSVSVRINLFLFSITISFSFRASFRFEWQLVGSSQQARPMLAAYRTTRRLAAPAAIGLCPGLSATLPLLYLPEVTVVFPNATDVGVPWVAVSLGVQYEPAPTPAPSYAAFKPFEAVATQLATFAVMHALDLASYDAIVTLDDDPVSGKPGLRSLDSDPELLTGWIGYADILGQLANFTASVALPTQATQATVFPMPPFLQLATTGRTDGTVADDLSYTFASKNLVAESYLQAVDAYFNQLFVNQTPTPPTLRLAADATTPLPTEIFLDYFKGLIRGAVHQLLVTMQDQRLAQATLTSLFSAVAGAPTPQSQSLFQQLAGQMSSSMRSGIRLPYASGLTVPGGAAATTTNPLFALLWQAFPVGGFAAGDAYTIALTNPDTTQGWLTPTASYTLGKATILGYYGLTQAAVTQPGNPQPIAFTEVGPQSFAFESRILLDGTLSLQPFPPNLRRLQRAEATAPVSMLIKSRAADGAYLPDGTPLPAADISLVTSIGLTVRQIPGGAPGVVLDDLFALSGASQSDEALLGCILADLRGGDRPIASIDILFQTAAGVPGLHSAPIDPAVLFVLRTNTSSVSQPPPASTMLGGSALPDGVAVGATAELTDDGGYGFLQIVQQATVTNAAGYYLRYLDTSGHSLPAALFVKGVGQVTLLIRYDATQDNTVLAPLSVRPYHTAAVLAQTQASLVYYAETTDPALQLRYPATAAGTFGVTLSRSDSVTDLTASEAVAAQARLGTAAPIDRADAIAALQASGMMHEPDIHAALAAMGAAPAALNALYSLVTYQVEASAGFVASNLSAPIQPQRLDDQDTASDYRIVVPLYGVATDNVGQGYPDRYASIGKAFTLDVFTNDAFGNQLPSPSVFGDTDLYFDPLLPVDQWTGVIASYDFANVGIAGIALSLTPTQSAFVGMSDTALQAALAHFLTIRDQITGPGVSFYVETSLAVDAQGNLVQFTLGVADTAAVTAMVAGMVAWLTDPTKAFPAAVALTVAVAGPGALAPAFPLAVLFGILRDPALISPYIKSGDTILLPAAQNVATTVAPDTGVTGTLSAFAASFVAAFPARKLAVGLTGTDAAQPPALVSSTHRLRTALRTQRLAADGSGGGTSSGQTLWAVEAAMLDVSIGLATGSGPRFLSPKPLDNALNTATVALPKLAPSLPSLSAQRLFVDVDLDQFNRVFFQTVDTVLGPASAAQAFATARAAYETIARGREMLAQGYASFEVDWLFGVASPFTGTPAQLGVAREVFEQQMRSALMTAYAVDTIVQYDVAWNAAVSPAVDQAIELFGQVEAIMLGSYNWTGVVLTATSSSAKSLSTGDQVVMLFTADAGSWAPADGVYTVTGTSGGTQFTLAVTNGSGQGRFSATRQNAGLSTAHVPIVSSGSSPLTFLYGTPDVADRAIVSMDLRFNITNLQYFLAPPGAEGEARPSLWLQLIDPYAPGQIPHVGPVGTTTDIPVVFRQYPTPPTLVRQGWTSTSAASQAANPIAAHAQWDYGYTYQAFLAAQDRIGTTVTYNTDLSATRSGPPSLRATGDTIYTLFEALARATAVIDAVRPVLQTPAAANWTDAVAAFAQSVAEVAANSDWNPSTVVATRVLALTRITDSYVVTDAVDTDPADPAATQTITLAWTSEQGESSYSGVTLALTALDPAATLQPYPGQTSTTSATALVVTVPNAPIAPLGVVQQIAVQALNVLAAENALASVQVERNLITLTASDQSPWQVVPAFVYKTAQVRPSQPVTPFIDVATAVDIASLPNLGSGAACSSASGSSLCQRIYTLMVNLLADPDQAAALRGAYRAAGAAPDARRRMTMGCAFRFPMPAVSRTAYDTSSLRPLVPIVLARSFDIDGQDPAQLGDFATLFAQAIDQWASANAVAYGSGSEPAGAQLVFDTTLYAALSGVDTPVLRFTALTLALTDIEPV
ncbi:hypothetical protein VH567_00730 [Sphingomonas sp. 4RDLI-65]|uniref:hypothetical protein n=1 Tax=Sphingomonas sp. 4RDLI-65 TaxID=3111641 RepID=UPI003C29623D